MTFWVVSKISLHEPDAAYYVFYYLINWYGWYSNQANYTPLEYIKIYWIVHQQLPWFYKIFMSVTTFY